MNKHSRNEKGSMLLDLIVGFGIIALLATITIPYLKRYQPNLKLNAAARTLVTDLRYAQQLTITEQTYYKVSLDIVNDKYQILKTGVATTTIKTVEFDPDVSYQEITGLSNDIVRFNFYGGVSQSGQIVLTNINNTTATINIKPSGYIQLEQ